MTELRETRHSNPLVCPAPERLGGHGPCPYEPDCGRDCRILAGEVPLGADEIAYEEADEIDG